MILTNLLNLPQPIADAVAGDDYHRGPSDISVTSLISPARKVALQEAHGATMTEDVSDRLYSLYGRLIHGILETADRTAIAELRLYMKVGPYTISGAMDRIALLDDGSGGVVISDYKFVSVNEIVRGVKIEREQQLNVYKILAELNGFKVSRLEAVFLLRDWSKVRAAVEDKRPRLGSGPAVSGYPNKGVVIHPVAIWDTNEAYRFIAERVQVHMKTQENYAQALEYVDASNPTWAQDVLPLCTDEERWAKEPVLAVMKEGNARASKLADTQEEAAAYVVAHPKDKYEVIPRPGESIHCEHYCAAGLNGICEQWKDIQLANA